MLALLLLHGPTWVYAVIIVGVLYYWLAVPVAALLLFRATRTSLRVALGLLGPLVAALGYLAVMEALISTASGSSPLLLYGLLPLAELLAAGYMLWRLMSKL